MWEAPASLQQCIEVILRIEVKQSYCEILGSVPAVLAKLSRNFNPSLSCCRALAKSQQYIASLSIYYRDMTCFDGLYLKKSHSACSVLGQNIDISFGPNGAPLGALWWSTLLSTSRSYELHLMSRYLVSARNQAESTEQSRFPPARVGFWSVGSPRAGSIH